MLFDLNCFRYVAYLEPNSYEIIKHRVFINATQQVVYTALVGGEAMLAGWSKPGKLLPYEYCHLFGNEQVGELSAEIILLTPQSYIEWECKLENSEWCNTLISFDIIEENAGVIVNFEHTGWGACTSAFLASNAYWNQHLQALKLYCEEIVT